MAKKGGRPRKSAPVSKPRKRGRPVKEKGSVDDYVRWLKAGGDEFLLLAPKRAGVDEMRHRAVVWYRGTPWKLDPALLDAWPLSSDLRKQLERNVALCRQEMVSFARARPLMVAELRRDQSLCAFFRQNAAGFKRMDAERKAAKRARRVARGGAASRLLRGRKKKALALALEARHYVHRKGLSTHVVSEILTKQEDGKTVSQSWISDNLRVLDQADRLFFTKLFLAAMAGYGFSFDAGTVTESEAGQRAKLLGVIISFSVPFALAPMIEPAAFGTAAVVAAKREAKANPFPPGFDEPRPKGSINAWILFSAQDVYVTSESDGRGRLVDRMWVLEGQARKDWGRLRHSEKLRWALKAKAENKRRAEALKTWKADLEKAWLAAERVHALAQTRAHRYPERPATNSAKTIYLLECAARPARLTTLALHNATIHAMLDAPDPIKTACAAKATALRLARWRSVRGLLPEALRAPGDASAAERCTWDRHRRHVVIDVAANPRLAARQAEARRHLGLATPRERVAPPVRDAPVDPDSWKDIFKQTVRVGSGLIDVRKAARLEDVEDSGPGRVERAPRRRGARRAKAPRKRRNEDDDEWDGED